MLLAHTAHVNPIPPYHLTVAVVATVVLTAIENLWAALVAGVALSGAWFVGKSMASRRARRTTGSEAQDEPSEPHR